MAYVYKKSLLANSGPTLIRFTIQDSETLTIGDLVSIATNGAAMLMDSASAAIAGVVHDIIDNDGNSVFGSIATLGGATVSGGNTVTVDASNVGGENISVLVDVSKFSIYSALVTGTVGTTTSSNLPGGWINSATTGDRVTETSHTRTVATGGHLKGWGVDPDDSTRILVSINESEIFDPTTGDALGIVS